jgi:hypothetical protein
MKTKMFLGTVCDTNKILKNRIAETVSSCEEMFSDCREPSGLYDLDLIYNKLRGTSHDLSAGDTRDFIEKMFHPRFGRLNQTNEIQSD